LTYCITQDKYVLGKKRRTRENLNQRWKIWNATTT